MTPDVNAAQEPRAVAILLHPHPDFGGNRFHPLISSLFLRLPEIGVSAIRFDFSSSDMATARDEAIAAIDRGSEGWPGVPVILAGYSFGAGIAAGVGDTRITAWYLVAPQVAMLKGAAIGGDPRPKAVVVPEHDQFSPPDAVAAELSTWASATLSTAPGVDHFLGVVDPIVDNAVTWIGAVLSA